MKQDVVASFFKKKTSKHTNCAIRLSHVVSELLGATLYDPDDGIDYAALGVGTLFLVNMPFYCSFTRKIVEMASVADRVVFIGDDYKSKMPLHIQQAAERAGVPVYHWMTIPERCTSLGDAYINWNLNTFQPEPLVEVHEPTILYWGTCRDGRIPYFQKYFVPEGPELPYQMHLSVHPASRPRYKLVGNMDIKFVMPFYDIKELQEYGATLYIQDTRHLTEYGSPANRFYEALAAGLAIFFDESCIGTFETAGYDITPYVVRNQTELGEAVKDFDRVRKEQRLLWGQTDYRGQLKDSLRRAYSSLP
mgnify:CR=1 FL=1